jgi:RNA polymerase-associated protein LEO1
MNERSIARAGARAQTVPCRGGSAAAERAATRCSSVAVLSAALRLLENCAMDAQTKLDLFGSDSEDDDDAPVPAPAAAGADDDVDEDDLFGGDDDDDEGGAAAEGAAAEVKEEEEPSKRGLAPPQELELPQMPAPPADAKLVLLKLPNILSREARPFDPETFADEGMDEESNAHLRLENVIRWRDVDGERQSNTRLVRWSDGSMTLHVGSEVLSATSQPLGKRGAGQEATQLFVRHKGAIFRCHGVLRERLLVQPTSTKSETHKALTKQIAKSHVKERRIKVVTTAEDPEKKKADDEKAWRQSNQLASAQEARRQRYSSGPELTEDFLEADDESQLEGNLGALKRGYKADQKRRAGGGGGARGAPGGKRARSNRSQSERDEFEDEDEEDEEDAWDEEEKRAAADGEMDDFIVGASDEEESAEESDEEEYGKKKKKGKKKARR